jgi:hypothetical protein
LIYLLNPHPFKLYNSPTVAIQLTHVPLILHLEPGNRLIAQRQLLLQLPFFGLSLSI